MRANFEGIDQCLNRVKRVASDAHSFCPMYPRVKLVRLRMAKCKCDVCLAKDYVSTAKVPARIERINLVHRKVVFSQEAEKRDEHCTPDDYHDWFGPIDAWAVSHAHEQRRCDGKFTFNRCEAQAFQTHDATVDHESFDGGTHT